MKKIIYIVISILIIINVNILGCTDAKAVSSINTIKSKNFSFKEDVNINGLYGFNVFFFDVNKNWNINNSAYLNLILSQSAINDNKKVTLIAYINDFPIYSKPLNSANKYKENIKIPIPVDKIEKGFNSVKIRTYNQITNEAYNNSLDLANWVVFHNESYVHIDFKDEVSTLNIKDYPYPFLKASEEAPASCIFIVPDNPKNYELDAAVTLVSNFGKRRKNDNININIYKYSDAKLKDKSDVIYITSKDNVSKEILDKLSDGEKITIYKSALIKEIVSPYNNNYKMLLIISNDSENLIKATQALCYDDIVMQMNSSSQIITTDFKINIKPIDKSEYFSLEKFGYTNVLLEGISRQQTLFECQTSKAKVIAGDAKAVIKIRYSKLLDFDKSLITLYINDVPIGSKKLSANLADNDSIEVVIPKEFRNVSFYGIKVAFDLPIKDINYKITPEATAWAFISKESYLYLPSQDKKDAYFEDYSSPFIKDYRFNDVVIVLPDNPSTVDISVMANMVAFLGHEIEEVGKINVIRSNDFSDVYKEKNVIAIGQGIKNTFIKGLNKDLYIKFNLNFDKFISNKNISILDEYSKDLGSLQLITSPYNVDKKIMIITSTKEDGLLWGEKYLTDFQFVSKLTGDALIIDELGQINSRYFGGKVKNGIDLVGISEGATASTNVAITSSVKNFIIFGGFTLIFIIISSVVVIIKFKRKS